MFLPFQYLLSVEGPNSALRQISTYDAFDLVVNVSDTFIQMFIEGWYVAQGVMCFMISQMSVLSIAEIGVHHGKSIISMLECSPKHTTALAIDVFDDQTKNYDGSGFGLLKIFKNNIREAKMVKNSVIIHQGDSLDLKSETIVQLLGRKVDLFSVDGCHTYTCTKSDLELAFKSLNENGLVILDDHFSIEWPGVSTGLGAFMSTNRDIVIFAIGQGKTFLCYKKYYVMYFNFIKKYCENHTCKQRQGANDMMDKVYII